MVTRDKIQSWLFVVCVRRPFMFQSYYQRPVVPFIYYDIQAAPAYEVTISQKVWYSELVVLIINSFLYRELLLTRELLNNWFLVVQVITAKVLRSPPWLGKPLGNICITNDHIICFYALFILLTLRSCPLSCHITAFVTRQTWRVLRVEQICSPFRKTWVHPRFLE